MTPATRGVLLGIAAMAMFGMTLPMTQLATGTAAVPHFTPEFVTCARAVLAATLSALWLGRARAPWPPSTQWRLLAVAAAGAWLGFAYVSLFSMWIAFFAWYRALARGDAVRVSQLQLLQPFFAMAFAWPIHGQPVALSSLGFGVAVIATVWLGRRFSATTPAPAAPPAGPASPARSTR